MIDDLDRSLRKLFELEFGAPLPFDLSFLIPDKNFKPVSTQRTTLNCYLYDIRENRELRDVDRVLARQAGSSYSLDTAPARIRSSYCITAWSPAEVTTNTDPYLDEHNLLAAVLRALLKHPEFPEAALIGTLVTLPMPMPTVVAIPEPGRNTGDFWNAIGGQLRPSIEYNVTLALTYLAADIGPLVSAVTLGTGERENGLPPPDFDRQYLIGGTVRSQAAGNPPVPDAWVRIDQTGEVAVADDAGQFVMQRIQPGSYNLRVRATGYKEHTDTLAVPLQAGSYDVMLEPL